MAKEKSGKRAEKSLFETSAEIKALVLAIPDIVYFKDRDRRNILVNRAFERAFDLKAADVLGKRDEEFLPADLAAACRKSDDFVLNGGQPIRFEETTVGPDGTAVCFETIKTPISDADGRIDGLIGISRDISARKNDEAMLRESEERFRSLYENSTLGLYRTTPGGLILLANPTLVRMLGYESDEQLKRRNLEEDGIEAEYPRAGFREKLEREGEIRGLEAIWKKRDGTPIYVRESARAIRGEDGAVRYYEGTVEDLTERKKIEEALRASEEKFRGLFENSLDGIYQSFPQGRFLTVNPALIRMFGYRDELEMCEVNIHDLYVHPEDRDAWIREIQTKRIVRNLEVRFKRRDGTSFTALETARAFFDGHGNVLYYEGILTDITARKTLEEEQSKSEALYRALFEHANDAVFLLSLSGDHIKVNARAAEMTGYTIEELAGLNVKAIVAPSEYGDSQEKLRRIVAAKGFPTYERTFRKKNGQEFPVEINASLILDEEGKPRFIQSIVRDISERKAKERALQAALQERELLLKEVHHRVKNNMQVVSSLLSLQSRYLKDPADAELMKESQRRIRSMALVHEKLYQSPSLTRIEFEGYLRQLSAQLLSSSEKKAGRIELKIDAEEIAFDVQTAIPLGLIVNELFTNALKHAFPGERRGEISIALHPAGNGEHLLTFKDNGVGLPDSFLPGQSETLGFQLVTLLVDQLEGRLDIGRRDGTEFRIAFREIGPKLKP